MSSFNFLDLAGVQLSDFSWYEVGDSQGFVERSIPQVFGELTLKGKGVTINVLNPVLARRFATKLVIVYDGYTLPVVDTGEVFVSDDKQLAAYVTNSTVRFGVRKEAP